MNGQTEGQKDGWMDIGRQGNESQNCAYERVLFITSTDKAAPTILLNPEFCNKRIPEIYLGSMLESHSWKILRTHMYIHVCAVSKGSKPCGPTSASGNCQAMRPRRVP